MPECFPRTRGVENALTGLELHPWYGYVPARDGVAVSVVVGADLPDEGRETAFSGSFAATAAC